MMVVAELIENEMFLPRQDRIVSFIGDSLNGCEIKNPTGLKNYLLFRAGELGLTDAERGNISEIPDEILIEAIDEANSLRNERRKKIDARRSLNGPVGYIVMPADEHPCAEYLPTAWSECKLGSDDTSFTPPNIAAIAKLILIGTQIARPVYAEVNSAISLEDIFQDEILEGTELVYRKFTSGPRDGEFYWNTFESLPLSAKEDVAVVALSENAIETYNDQRGRVQAESEELARGIIQMNSQKAEFERAISTIKRNWSILSREHKYSPIQTPKNISENFFSANVRRYVDQSYDGLKHIHGNAKKVTEDKIYRMALAEKMSSDGMSKSEISEYLGVSEKTVTAYLTEIGKSSRELRMERMTNLSKKALEHRVNSQKNPFFEPTRRNYSERFA